MKRIICIFLMIIFYFTSLNALDFYDDFTSQHKYLGFNHELKNKKYVGSKDKIYYYILKTPLRYTKKRKGEIIFFLNSRTKESWRIDVAVPYRAHMTHLIISQKCKIRSKGLITLSDIKNMDKNLIDFSIKALGIDKKEAVFWLKEKGKAYSFYDDKIISTRHMVGKQLGGDRYPKRDRYLFVCKTNDVKYYNNNMKGFQKVLDKHYRIEEDRARNRRMRKKVKVGDYTNQGKILGVKGNKVLMNKDECVATYDWGGCAEWKKIPRWISKERISFGFIKEK